MSDDELREYYKKFDEQQFIDELEDFLTARQKYLKDQTPQKCVEMQMAFDKIYVSTKSLWVYGLINEDDFWRLKEELQDVDRA